MRRLAVLSLLAAATIHGATLPPLSLDRGATGVWQKLLKLQTTASVLQTTAHPDDEQGGLLAALSRGQGVRVGLLTINRGEAGDNAIGSELFDALGLIRTDELTRAGQVYGLDAQYFTQVADYGYSKRLEEAMTEWDRDLLLKDMVRAIRRFRPLVVVSRWQGGPRDGHGQHQAAGALTPPAVAAAADPSRFPELAAGEGLPPWRVLKLYAGGAREGEPWQVRVDTGTYDAVLGDSYAALGRTGLSLQRSQTAGRNNPVVGVLPLFYTRVDVEGGTRESSLFDGLDTSLPGAYRLTGGTPPPGGVDRLVAVARQARAALDAFSWTDPSASAPALSRGLDAIRRARPEVGDDEVAGLLAVKEEQFAAALTAALGLEASATAQPAGLSDPAGPFAAFAPPPTLDAVTAGQTVDVRVVVASRSPRPVKVTSATLLGPAGLRVPVEAEGVISGTSALSARASLTVPADAPATRPYFTRSTIGQTRYTLIDPAQAGRPAAPPAFQLQVDCLVDGTALTLRVPVVRREAQLPYGHVLRELEILPAVGVSLTPSVLIAPAGGAPHRLAVEVDVVAYAGTGAAGEVTLQVPDGWSVTPASRALALPESGAHARLAFAVTAPRLQGAHQITAVARIGERTHTTGYQVIRHRDLPLRYLVRDATAMVAPVEVSARPGLRVGYVMGVGDEVPAAIAQLGASVTLLDREALATGDLSRFHTIVTGTRAYAVRDDLRAHNRRLLEWVRGGGNMVVLYNTPEFAPEQFAPYGGSLPGSAEEVSEQSAPVRILAPDHALLTRPNRITAADFDGWIEQRGSKFFAEWDQRYTPLVSSHDQGQAPQEGGLLTATYGKGRWTYMAYALHRQVPYGVGGAYRILENLVTPPDRRR